MRTSDAEAGAPGASVPQPVLYSVLYRAPGDPDEQTPSAQPDCFPDLNLDQVVEAVVAGWKDCELPPFFHAPLHDLDAVAYRQEALRDLDGRPLLTVVKAFTSRMREMRLHLAGAHNLYYGYEKLRWFLAAVQTYSAAVRELEQALSALELGSRAMRALHEHVRALAASPAFVDCAAEADAVVAGLAAIRYGVVIHGGTVTVRPFGGEQDYAAQVEATFEKFRRGAVKDYLTKYKEGGSLNHIEAQILDRVALLHPEAFGALQAFHDRHQDFLDPVLERFDREVHFYLAWLAHLDPLRAAGLPFCFPELTRGDKHIRAGQSFDLALARKRVMEQAPVVRNDFFLDGEERIFVVSGPNNGGKTTFARMLGQLHYLASLGLQVPGTQARLFLCDRVFTHFERHEDIANLRGKLQDDLVRIRDVLAAATPRSLVILNEIFSSTTLEDAVFLSREVMRRLSALDALGVCVTFLSELSSFDRRTVSMVSTVDPDDPAVRTYQVVRRPADGLAYALAIARKYRVTHDDLLARIPP